MNVPPELLLSTIAVVVGIVAAVIERRREREDVVMRERLAVLEATALLRLDAFDVRVDQLVDELAALAESVAALSHSPRRRT